MFKKLMDIFKLKDPSLLKERSLSKSKFYLGTLVINKV